MIQGGARTQPRGSRSGLAEPGSDRCGPEFDQAGQNSKDLRIIENK
jgi:hypothetical protein